MSEVIIDTDPGVDDALAILLAIEAKLGVIALTTVFGNSSVEDSSKNALTILEVCNVSNIPVYQGADRPLVGEATRANSHGKGGLGEFSVKTNRQIEKEGAVDSLINKIESGSQPIDILAIGPLTNIATLIQKRPDLTVKINSLVMMVGVFGEKGNTTDYAEFNAYNDPEALKIVLKSPVNKILIPANVCRSVVFDNELFDQLDGLISQSLRQITDSYIDYYKSDDEFGGFTGGVMYDLLATAYLIRPELFEISNQRVEVELNGERRGLTTFSQNGYPCSIAQSVDSASIRELFISSVNGRDNA